MPGRVRKPRDKAKAENGVLQAQRWILAVLRKQIFYSLEEMNVSIGDCLKRLNAKIMRGYGKSRQELFHLLDQPVLKPLPSAPYEWSHFEKTRLGADYHVRFEDYFYSAPYALHKEELWLKATGQMITIYARSRRVASHPRSAVQWGKSTLSEHMPPQHQAGGIWEPERLLTWAEKVGPATHWMTQSILASKAHPHQGAKAAMGLMSLEREFGAQRLEKASVNGREHELIDYRALKAMLHNHMEEAAGNASPEEVTFPAATPQNSSLNLRGKGHYH